MPQLLRLCFWSPNLLGCRKGLWMRQLSIKGGSRWPGIRSRLSINSFVCTSSAGLVTIDGITLMVWEVSILSASHCILGALKLLQCCYHLIHGWSELGICGQASECEVCCLLGFIQWVLTFKTIVENTENFTFVGQVRLGPFYQVMFSRWSVLIHCSSSR